MNKSKKSDSKKPTTEEYVIHIAVLILGIALLFYVCFVNAFPGGFAPTFRTRVVIVVVVILAFGFYLRRFGRLWKR